VRACVCEREREREREIESTLERAREQERPAERYRQGVRPAGRDTGRAWARRRRYESSQSTGEPVPGRDASLPRVSFCLDTLSCFQATLPLPRHPPTQQYESSQSTGEPVPGRDASLPRVSFCLDTLSCFQATLPLPRHPPHSSTSPRRAPPRCCPVGAGLPRQQHCPGSGKHWRCAAEEEASLLLLLPTLKT